MSLKAVRGLFGFAAIYDGVLGLAFLIAPAAVLGWFDVPPPNHLGYLRFPACILLIFALMFARIAADPVGRRGEILYGILLKLSYAAVTIGYWVHENASSKFVLVDFQVGHVHLEAKLRM